MLIANLYLFRSPVRVKELIPIRRYLYTYLYFYQVFIYSMFLSGLYLFIAFLIGCHLFILVFHIICYLFWLYVIIIIYNLFFYSYRIIRAFLATLCVHDILPFMFMFMFQFVFMFHIIFRFRQHIYTYFIFYIFPVSCLLHMELHILVQYDTYVFTHHSCILVPL